MPYFSHFGPRVWPSCQDTQIYIQTYILTDQNIYWISVSIRKDMSQFDSKHIYYFLCYIQKYEEPNMNSEMIYR